MLSKKLRLLYNTNANDNSSNYNIYILFSTAKIKNLVWEARGKVDYYR